MTKKKRCEKYDFSYNARIATVFRLTNLSQAHKAPECHIYIYDILWKTFIPPQGEYQGSRAFGRQHVVRITYKMPIRI